MAAILSRGRWAKGGSNQPQLPHVHQLLQGSRWPFQIGSGKWKWIGNHYMCDWKLWQRSRLRCPISKIRMILMMDAKIWMVSLIIMFAVPPICAQDAIFKMSSMSPVWVVIMSTLLSMVAQSLPSWQPLVPQVMTKLASWWLLCFS